MTKSKIEWTEHVWNPVRGCSRVSPGCDNCYAMRQAHRTHGPGGAYDGLTTIRNGNVDWTGFARFVPEQLEVPLRRKKPTTYFVNSMSDLFHESLNDSDICALFGVMSVCPQHTFQVLTKRAKRMLEWFESLEAVRGHFGGMTPGRFCRAAAREGGLEVPALPPEQDVWPLPNVWLGVSAENQEQANKRIPLLLKCSAAVRWVSAEPLLGAVAFDRMWTVGDVVVTHCSQHPTPTLDWVVVGGESGHGARECKIEWIESIVRQCTDAKVPVFVKQLGAQVFVTGTVRDSDWDGDQETRFAHKADGSTRILLTHSKGGDASAWPEHLRVRQFPEVA